MPITFNTNLAALGAQRNISISSNAASSSLSKLSSGSRIPQAKDDAAGLAVGSKLKSEISGLTQAANNAGQAISLLQIADGALATIGDVLQRMKTLAVQSSSGQLDDSSRALLNQEFTNLKSEVDRVAGITNFNGTKLLNGGDVVATTTEVQGGYLAGKGVNIAYNTAVTADNGVMRVDYDYTAGGTEKGILTVTNMTTGEKQSIDIAAAIRAQTLEGGTTLTTNLGAGKTVDVNFAALGVTLTVDSTFDVNADFGVAVAVDAGSTVQAAVLDETTVARVNGGDLTPAQLAAITGFDPLNGKLTLSVDDSVDDVLTINANAGLEFSLDGVTFTATLDIDVDGATASSLYIRATGGDQAFARVDIAAAGVVDAADGDAANTLVLNGFADGLASFAETTAATATFSFKVGSGVSANDDISFTLNGATTSALGVSGSTITTTTNANLAIAAVNDAITSVASRRAEVGAAQSRLDFASTSISVAIENTSAATSAIMDVDVSAEITNFTNKNVLMQAGISLLGQANQQPALLLRLLQ
ncbi:MAG: hypothetical protein EON60_07895 [Alphaproteobacteria bacterium]|nr:MAG: hypothetical protein EON60_07895 [Alphaproteobacteria bacterium]